MEWFPQNFPLNHIKPVQNHIGEKVTHYDFDRVQVALHENTSATRLQYFSFDRPTLAVMLQGAKQLLFDESSIDFRDNGCLAIAPDVPVWVNIQEASPEQPVVCLTLTLDEEYARERLDMGVQMPASILSVNEEEQHYWYYNDDGLYSVLQRFVNLSLENNTCKEEFVQLALAELLLRLAQTGLRQNFLERPQSQFQKTDFDAVLEYIDTNITETISIETLCALAHTSKSVLFRKFRAVFNTTPIDFILRKKIEMAKKMLVNNNGASVKQVGMECGFNSESYFSNIFKRYTGTNPQSFRKEYNEGIAS